MTFRKTLLLIGLITCLLGCNPISTEPTTTLTEAPGFNPTEYLLPSKIDPEKKYLFYIHGRIIEEQGLPAISPDFGEYRYPAILETLRSHGFVVISEQRPKGTISGTYANEVVKQISALLDAGVPAQNITVVGASKGASITIHISHFLENADINYVLLAICHQDVVDYFLNEQIHLVGNVLSIYDYADDEFASSCQALFRYSEGKGLSLSDEIVTYIGSGHGILYKPLDAWVLPTLQWANQDYE